MPQNGLSSDFKLAVIMYRRMHVSALLYLADKLHLTAEPKVWCCFVDISNCLAPCRLWGCKNRLHCFLAGCCTSD